MKKKRKTEKVSLPPGAPAPTKKQTKKLSKCLSYKISLKKFPSLKE